MEIQLILTACLVTCGFALFVQPDKQIGNQASRANGDGEIQENFKNLLDSIANNDTNHREMYQDMLKQEVAREQRASDAMKETLRIVQTQKRRNHLKTSNAHTNLVKRQSIYGDVRNLTGITTFMKCKDPTSIHKPCAHYCTIIRVNNTLYLSGMIAMDKTADKLVEGGIKHETQVIFKNIKKVLTEQGSCLENIIQVRAYMRNLKEDYRAFNDLYQYYIRHPFPARSVVGVSQLPEDANLMVEVTAVISDEPRFETDD